MDIRHHQASAYAQLGAHTIEPEPAVLAFGVFEDATDQLSAFLPEQAEQALRVLTARNVIRGKAGEAYYLPTPLENYVGVLILGLGKPEDFEAETLRRCAGKAGKILTEQRARRAVWDASLLPKVPYEPFFEGISLSQYAFDRYKSKEQDDDAPVPVEVGEVILPDETGMDSAEQRSRILSRVLVSTAWARDLANRSSDDLSPAQLAGEATAMAESLDCKCTVFKPKEMESLGMGGILAVGRGSRRKPRLIVLDHHPQGAEKTLALVGKGITFDSGGISIKPGKAMHEMKYDMCGAAAVLGAFKTLCEAHVNVRVVCVVPAAENMPDGRAYSPGDIIKTYSGKTVETHNTDAEGRIILADALAYAAETYQPSKMVDLATLTGSVLMALGHHAAGLMSNSGDVSESLQIAADQTDERIWELPLYDDFSDMMKGEHADLKNIPGESIAGTVTAGAFLQEFAGDTPWAHLDIAGTAWGGKHQPYLDPKYATGYGVRLLTRWGLNEAE